MRQLFRELKRRNVYKVAVTYAVVAFVVVQAADLLFPRLLLPAWSVRLVIGLALLGFPIALVLAWAFEMTPEGVRRTPEVGRVEGQASEDGGPSVDAPAEGAPAPGAASDGSQARLGVKALAGLALAAAAVAGGWYLMGGGGGTGEAVPRAGPRSIAVLPFENMGGEESEQFTRGVHDDLLTRLAHVSGLRVISRTAVERYRGSGLTTGAIADSLGVRWVMEGAVQKMGDQIQVNAQLIDPGTETHAWAEKYRMDLTAENLFAIQSEVTKKIARSLEAELSPAERRRVESRPTADLEAYKLYVRGRRLLDRRTGESIREASEYFERALRQDSSYALAWAGLADARGLSPFYGPGIGLRELPVSPLEAAIPEAKTAARRALELDPDLAEAHASRGIIYVYEQEVNRTGGHGPAALRRLQRAVELKPSYAQAHAWLGSVQLLLGRIEPGLEHLELAVQLNPENRMARGWMIDALIAAGRYEAALAEARALQARYRDQTSPVRRIEALAHLGRWQEVRRIVQEHRSRTARAEPLTLFLALADVARGDTASARDRIERSGSLGEYGPRLGRAFIHAALGDMDAAFPLLREAFISGSGPLVSRLPFEHYYSDLLGPMREDPRYRELIRQMNVQWGLNPDGSLPDSVDVSFGAQPDD